MGFFYIAPGWFFGLDVLLQLLFGLITGIVALFSYRVYKLCDQRECRLLGVAFGFISVSYFLWALLNFFVLDEIRRKGEVVALETIRSLPLAGAYFHMLLFLTGLCFLVYVTMNVRNEKVLTLLMSLSLIVVIFSKNAFLAFNFVAALLLFYVCLFYYRRFAKSQGKGGLMLAAFSLLFLARIDLVFSVIHGLPYVANHILELIGYGLMIFSLARVIKK